MRVEISESAHGDVLDGYWFYNRRDPDWVRMHISNVR